MSSLTPQLVLIYNRRKKATASSKAVVELRISYNKQQKYISTGIWLFPNQWKNGLIVNCPDAMQISQTLSKLVTDARQVLLDMVNAGNVDLKTIPEKIKQLNAPKINFIEFCRQRAEIRKYGKRADTQERYNRFIRRFEGWGGIKEFEDITEQNIIRYDRHLARQKMKVCSKWHNHHRFLNAFILDAIDEGLLQRNPYKWVNIDRGEDTDSLRKHLTPEEFRQLEATSMPTEALERIKDLFIFQTYTCMAYSDLKNFNPEKIKEVKGTNVYTGSRKKTSQTFTIPLQPEALKILEKYSGRLPLISNVKYNAHLKKVAEVAGIDKPISTHWARHTGATLLLNKGVPMQIVSKICGHSSTRITEQVYAKLLDETVVDAIQGIQKK